MSEPQNSQNGAGLPSRVLVAGLFVVALIVAGVWVMVSRQSSDTPEATASTLAPTVVETQAGVSDSQAGLPETDADTDSVCGLAAGDQTIPSTALLSVPLTVGDGLDVPFIDGVGPGVSEGISHCFAHSPSGAVLAAANFMVWFSSMQDLPDVTEALVASGEDRDRLVALIESEWGGQTGSPVAIHGYQYEDRGPDHALVVLAVSTVSAPTDLVAWPVPLVWQDGDWKVIAPVNNSWGESVITSLQVEGFVEWGA